VGADPGKSSALVSEKFGFWVHSSDEIEKNCYSCGGEPLELSACLPPIGRRGPSSS
jgi:hypothetical protein